jgi:G3E family GTPase
VPLEILLAVGRFDPETALKLHEQEDRKIDRPHEEYDSHGLLFDTWSYESEHPFSLTTLREMVRKDHPASIYRCKGIVFTADSPEKRLALQTVGRRTEIFELDKWGGKIPRSQIVAIGAPGGINGAELTK